MSRNKWNNIKEIKSQLKGLLTRKVKSIIFSVAASLAIGVIFGLISLQMAEKNGNSAETAGAIVNSDEQRAGETFDSISFYVVQAGVFEKNKNAAEWSERFLKAGVPTIKWERQEEVYLLAGISSSEEMANKQAKKWQEANLDVFVKEWKTQTGSLTTTASDEAYLATFLDTWRQSLQEQDTSEMQTFVKRNAETSEAIQPFVEKLETIFKDKQTEEQLVLLETIEAYEKLFQ